MSCIHLDQVRSIRPPTVQSVHREECTLCFDGQDSPTGVDVCLICFNGGCLDSTRQHAKLHFDKTQHGFTLNVKRKLKPNAQRIKALTDGTMTSLSSSRQSEVKAWEEEIVPCEHTLMLQQESSEPIPASGLAHCRSCDLKENLWLCMTCGSLGCGRPLHGGLGGNGHGLAHFNESKHPVSVKLGTITPEGNADIFCYLCDDSKQDPELSTHLHTFGILLHTLSKTEKSMTELQLEHNLSYDFALTSSSDGSALQPLFGPGLTGLQNLGNSCYMASVLQAIFALRPWQERYGAAYAKEHLGRCGKVLPAECVECQMYKVADGLLSGRYSRPASMKYQQHSDGEAVDSSTLEFQEGVRPVGLKTVIGKGHAEFATMRQQDAEEFLTYLINTLRRDGHKSRQQGEGVSVQDPTTIFSYGWEQRLQCTECKGVRYMVEEADVVSVSVPATEKGKAEDGKMIYGDVELWKCLDALLGVEALEYVCPSCRKTVHALKQTKFAAFPDTLVIHAKKFQLVNWVPAKLDIPVILPANDILEFNEKHLGKGLQPGEEELRDAPPEAPQFDAEAMAMLEGMGFPTIRCQKALLATGNQGAEVAMEWLFEHMEDPDIDEPIRVPAGGGAGGAGAKQKPEPSAEMVSMLADMGFTSAQAKKALRETDNDMERAVEWLFSHPDDDGSEAPPPASSTPATATATVKGTKTVPARYALKAFISHKGPSVHSGHYVAHIRKGEDWVLFNDEKVVKADEESVRTLKSLTYLYVFEKV
ncbi:ubiquitinyl hydrolase [Macrolepiota fuliginosa MF-IS2]|uniref:Ubiquitin carboxyl-terminal hydrolase n=1 Tax=Macrolepiota fuliginosa MF-IS2 TaxID=1400762 RepID=A0A9P6BYY6_9AGAR|nr:ubiquitinyl hydrolase [Macrolepiota fuliginosa MF-IS2]